ncbi:hypothetical protein [Montanilutibacter psychrotolerans]|nr:hypothetical protein [Lysobacter psychrotolerans]
MTFAAARAHDASTVTGGRARALVAGTVNSTLNNRRNTNTCLPRAGD